LPDIDVEALYKRYGPMVFRRCRHLLGDEELALDASQDVFVKIWQHRERLTGDSESGLLLRIATRTCLNKIRSITRRRENSDDEFLETIACAQDTGASVIARLNLEDIFCREQPSTRVMAVMHYLDGLTLEQVAKEVGLSVSGVRKRLKALQKHARNLEGLNQVD
jgi:RNA polymerase sigma factor (sigma-70 family)